jgi:hypothetical protein
VRLAVHRLTLLSSLFAAAAWASPTFPAVIHTHLSLSADPACALCHTNGITGFGTVTTPFGLTVHKTYGAQSENEPSLIAALDKMADAGVDSDGDGVGDIAELKAGTDPNVSSTGAGSTLGLKYGCGADVVPSLAAVLGVLVFAARRRR